MIFLIAAMAKNGTIGNKGELPWSVSQDLLRFKQVTMGQTLLFGRKTYESLKKPLEGRKIIILTKCSNYREKGCITEVNIENVLNKYLYSKDILYVAGGASIYRQFIGHAQKIFLTEIDYNCEGDAFFPLDRLRDFVEISRENSDDNGISLSFVVYERARC